MVIRSRSLGRLLGSRWVCSMVAALLALVVALPVGAQTLSSVSGTVVSTDGAPIPGAVVVATSEAFTREATTDAQGNFRLPALPAGNYEISVASEGFQKEVRTDFELLVNANVTLDFELQLGSIEDIVTHRSVNIHGMLITLKLLTWEMADQIDACVERIRSWGYRHVRVRQLAFNRREVCVLAAKNKARMRSSTRK